MIFFSRVILLLMLQYGTRKDKDKFVRPFDLSLLPFVKPFNFSKLFHLFHIFFRNSHSKTILTKNFKLRLSCICILGFSLPHKMNKEQSVKNAGKNIASDTKHFAAN